MPTEPSGFTIVELLIVVALVAVVLALAAPSFWQMIQIQRLRGTNAQLVTDIQFARTEAASRQEIVGMTFETYVAGKTCYTVHTCGTVSASVCFCDCTLAEGARCNAPQREIRTVEVPTSSGVLVSPVPVGSSPDLSNRVTFDPATGGITTYFDPLVVGPTPSPINDFWIETSLGGGSAVPTLRVVINAPGRPRVCAPGGRVSGVPAC